MSGRIDTFVAETIRMAIPYMACGLGAVVTERAGVVNIGLEGALAVAGLGAAVGAIATGSGVAGCLTGVGAAVAYCALHGALVLRARVDAIVSGIALTMASFGLSRVVLRVLYDSASNSPRVPGFEGATSSWAVARVLTEPAVLLFAVVAVLVTVVLGRTRFGLRLRACGEGPDAAAAAGVDVGRVRLWASALSGLACGLGGVHLVFDQHRFDAGMSGGRGFIALAAAILGARRPGATLLACAGFAALEAAQITVQDASRFPPEIVQMMPFVVTLLLLAWMGRRAPQTR